MERERKNRRSLAGEASDTPSTPKLGIRADGLLVLSIGGSVLAGALGLSYIPVECHSDKASHGLELGLGVAAGVGGPSDLNMIHNREQTFDVSV